MTETIHFKSIDKIDEIQEVVSFQNKIWGQDAVTSLPQLAAAIHSGGVLLGAYEDKNLIGFCYGFAGYRNRQPFLVSHMMAINPAFRNVGIGNKLKNLQRKWAIEYGYQKIAWTFDPLESRNAYLNIAKLGGYVRTYIPAYYGDMSDNINYGMPSDRFYLEWDIVSESVCNLLDKGEKKPGNVNQYQNLVRIEQREGIPKPKRVEEIENANGYLVSVPHDIHSIKKTSIDIAEEWRYALRSIFITAFFKGYAVTDFIKGDEVNYYFLEKLESGRP